MGLTREVFMPNSKQKKIAQPIPTNIITGFLGVGKTTLILELLKQKPKHETWAVLVNEFGEVGIDGNILSHSQINQKQISIREVPGGCMCCTSGLPMQIALNQLIAQSNPSRLLIEPTGLGHPREVIQSLSQEHYQNTIDLKATLTLLDARKLNDSRYTEHDIFQQQIQVADLIIATKSDLYQQHDSHLLEQYIQQQEKPNTPIHFSEYGRIDSKLLDQLCTNWQQNPENTSHVHSEQHSQEQQVAEPSSDNEHGHEQNEELYLRRENQGKGYYSCGWIFDPVITFDYQKLQQFLSSLNFERSKAIAITQEGVFGFNKEGKQLSQVDLNDCMDSRLEIISLEKGDWDQLEIQLLDCCDYKPRKRS